MKNIKTIFFDIDDTLLNHSGAKNKAAKDLRKKHYPNITLKKFSLIWSQFTKKNWLLYEQKQLTFEEQGARRVTDVWKTFGRSISAKEADKIFAEYLSLYQKHWRPFPHALNTLKKLHACSFSLGILSNGQIKQQKDKLKHLKIYPYLNEKLIIISEEVDLAKPGSEIFLHAQNLAGVKPKEILFIGNSLHDDIEPGKKIGWNVLFFDYFNLFPGKQSIKNFKDILNLFK